MFTFEPQFDEPRCVCVGTFLGVFLDLLLALSCGGFDEVIKMHSEYRTRARARPDCHKNLPRARDTKKDTKPKSKLWTHFLEHARVLQFILFPGR